MQPQILFRVISSAAGAIVAPLMPLKPDGSLRMPNGSDIVTLDDAVARTKLAPDALRRAYEDFVGDVLTPDDAGRLADPRLYARAADQLKGEVVDAALHRLKFPHISLEFLGDLMLECQQRGLNPWSRHVWAEQRFDPNRNQVGLFVGTTIDGLRAIAEQNTQYRGQVGPQWCGEDGQWKEVWVASTPPVAARVGVRRADWPAPRWGIATFAECAIWTEGPDGEKALIPFWRDRPAHMLAKVAEAFAIRACFPETAGLFTREEMGPAPSPPAVAAASSAAHVQADPTPELRESAMSIASADRSRRVYINEYSAEPMEDDDATTSRYRFELALVDAGFSDPPRRHAMLKSFCGRWPGLLSDDPREFRRLVLQEVRARPQTYTQFQRTPPAA